MITVCLATIPPRFDAVGDVLDSLLNQSREPDQIILSWCRTYARFPGTFSAPPVPDGVTMHETCDIGPLTKLSPLPNLQGRVVWCDDDVLYGSGWLQALINAQTSDDDVVAATTFPIRRLRRDSDDLVVQGFGGVSVPVSALTHVLNAPKAAIWADDIWISGHLAAQNIPVIDAPKARDWVHPLTRDGALQDQTNRKLANQQAAQAVTDAFGIWPAY